jgi:iron complex outermembrane receptor protein
MTLFAVRPRFVASVLMMLVIARASPGQGPARNNCSITRADTAASNTRWAPPLDRSVTVRFGSLSLREAIDRVAAASNLRVSYSAELLPLDRQVCLNAQSAVAGQVLAHLLDGTNVAAIGVGGDQVVLTPRTAAPAQQQVDVPEMANSVGVLDRVVVTGNATLGAPERELTVGVNVLDGRQLARDGSSSIASALDSYVPGVWSWTRSPSSMMSSYGSIRGASSFGLTYPKMYIDGIEVANPLLVGRFNAASVDRIEVIRGPQGSALYGTDAISGVVNIVSRYEGASDDGRLMSVRSSAGLSQSSYARNVLAQDHELSLTTGTSARSADLHISASGLGSFIPDGYSRDLMASGSARIIGNTSTFSTTARLFVEQAGSPVSPLITPSTNTPAADPASPSANASGPMHYVGAAYPQTTGPTTSTPVLPTENRAPQSVSEYTLGATATTSPNDSWTHSFVAGIDGYRLANVQTNTSPVPSAADLALRAAEGSADRATLRASSELHLNAGEATRATFIFSAEHATLRATTAQDAPIVTLPQQMWVSTPASDRATTWQNSTGVTAQTNLAWNNTLFATGGLRAEHDSRLAASDAVELLPMLGGASVTEFGPLTVKLRAAYGKGIRPPTTASRTQLWQVRDGSLTQAPLGPERQAGIESGIDFYFQHALSLQVTHFDQRASGLIQQVAVPADTGGMHRMMYVAQNVGEISNRGWEFQATSNVSRLAVTGSVSLVDSRVQKLAAGYSGDLVTGDRMLGVPGQTGSLNFAWTAPKWTMSFGGSRAFNWINYDELALADAFNSASRSRDLTGDRLRQYWRNYDGGLHLRALMSRDIRDGFAVELSADNLLNYQRGEPDNLTIIPGRTIMTGVRVKF